MSVRAIVLDDKDTVATCIQGATVGDVVQYGTGSLLCSEQIPPYHKISLIDIAEGESVYKYGEVIGTALVPIPQGAWVSDHNIVGLERDYETQLL